MLRIRPGHPSGRTIDPTHNTTSNLNGGLYMWHKDSAGNWYMAENKDTVSDGIDPSSVEDGLFQGKASSGNTFNLGTGSSIYLFSSLARGA